MEGQKFKRTLEGVIVSDKNSKTIVVSTTRKFKHAKYSKFIKETKKFHAHDEKMVGKVGDRVLIIESKAHSRLKKWELLKVIS